MILMHFINHSLMSCCIRSSAPPGRRGEPGLGVQRTPGYEDMSPPATQGPALGYPALHHPPILTGSAAAALAGTEAMAEGDRTG